MAINAGTVQAFLELDTSRFRNGMATAQIQLHQFGDSTQNLSTRMNNFGSAMMSAGATMTKAFTLPLAVLGGMALNAGIKFDDAMAKVRATSGATGKEFDALKEKARELGGTTRYSATEAAEGLNYLAMAGWSTKEMIEGIPAVLDLATASGTDLATTADIVSDALTSFGLEASDAAHFSDVLAVASSSANTNVVMMGESFKYCAPIARQFGMSIEETGAALAIMANSGIKASQAGTTLRSALSRLASQPKMVSDELEKLRVRVTDSRGDMLDFGTILERLRNKFARMSEQERISAASHLFGQQAMSGMLAILGSSKKEFDQYVKSMKESEGATSEMAETMESTLGGSLRNMKSAFEELLLVIYETVGPVFAWVIDGITGILRWLSQLNPVVLQMIIYLAMIVATIGPVLLIVGQLSFAISNITNLFGGFNIATLKTIGIVMGVVIALTALAAIIAVLTGKTGELERTADSISNIGRNMNGVDTGGRRTRVPHFAEGGIATAATLGVFGEAGDEAILPLAKLDGIMERSLINASEKNTNPVQSSGNSSYYETLIAQNEKIIEQNEKMIENGHKSVEATDKMSNNYADSRRLFRMGEVTT